VRLGLRLLFAFFVIAGLAGFFAMRVFVGEVRPSVREAMEDLLVDTANLVAIQAAEPLRAMPPGGDLRGSGLAREIDAYRQRAVDARIWGLHKRTLDLRIYVTDARGRVVLDSATPPAIGADYSQWRDVALTLRGAYGARATREVVADERSSVFYVAAPVRDGERVIGVVTVAKPVSAVQPFIDRAEREITVSGAWLLALSVAVGVAVTLWMVSAVRRLRRYATEVQAGSRVPVPELPGELGDLAHAVDDMRARLEERERLEHTVGALVHELKSPLTAIQGAAELLHEPLPDADRQRFAGQVQDQALRLRDLVDRLLALSRLEGLRALAHPQALALRPLAESAAGAQAALAAQRGIQVRWSARDEVTIRGDADALALLFSNLWANAVDFAPDGSVIDCALAREDDRAVFTLRDRGPGVPDFALPQLGARFFSMPRPRDGRRGSGLGLAIVRQVVALHGAEVAFENAAPGLRVVVRFPVA
jgi:two-component system sensor histidine kinase CreC